MGEISQENAPIYEALENLRKKRVVPFDVPGHREAGATRSWQSFGERDA